MIDLDALDALEKAWPETFGTARWAAALPCEAPRSKPMCLDSGESPCLGCTARHALPELIRLARRAERLEKAALDLRAAAVDALSPITSSIGANLRFNRADAALRAALEEEAK